MQETEDRITRAGHVRSPHPIAVSSIEGEHEGWEEDKQEKLCTANNEHRTRTLTRKEAGSRKTRITTISTSTTYYQCLGAKACMKSVHAKWP